jgi:protein-disulfide isomerase
VTQGVKALRSGGCGEAMIEIATRVHYNHAVTTPRISRHFALLMLVMTPLLAGGACEKKPANSDTSGAGGAIDRSDAQAAPVDKTPLQGFDLKLQGEKAELFYRLVGSLNSPCQKPHSLRQSFTKDPGCKRAPFALRYITALIEDEVNEPRIREEYKQKYEDIKMVKIDVAKAPKHGNESAPIKLVEFFDYECPHCQQFKPMLDKLHEQYEGKIVTYYMMFPIESKHPNSRSAAQAALAANTLGKFKAMHDILFAQTAHDRDAVMSYALTLALDVNKFEPAYNAVSEQVTSDLKQGHDAGVDSTPTLFFNDRKYEAPLHPRYLAMWIDEELAVNR